MNFTNGVLTMFVSLMSMIIYGYIVMYDDHNANKGKRSFYSVFVLATIAIIFFLIGMFEGA